MSNQELITKGWREQGLSLRHEGNETLALVKDGQVIARFSQSGVTIENILKEVECGKYGN